MPTFTWSQDNLVPNSENAYGTSGSPALVEFQGKLFIIHEGRHADGQVYCATYDGTRWSDDNLVPSSENPYGTSGPPAAVVFNDILYVIREGKGDDGWLWWASFNGVTWSRDALVKTAGGHQVGTSGRPALAVFQNKIYCVHEGRGSSGWVWCTTFDGTSWSEDALIPDSTKAYGTSGPPSLAVFGDKLYCAREGRKGSGQIWCATNNGTSWGPDGLIPNSDSAYGTTGAPALAVFNNTLFCVHQGSGDQGYVWCGTNDGTSWSTDARIPDDNNTYGTSGPPALAVFDNKLYCLREGRSSQGWMWGGTATSS